MVKYSSKNEFLALALTQSVGLRVSITDHGSVMPDKLYSRIFQRFTQAGCADMCEKGGFSLCLSIAKANIEHHGGCIDLDSEPDKEITLYFKWPEMQG